MEKKPVVVDGIDITRRYSIQEILDMHARGRLRPIGLQGWIVRADADGTVGFVPATESTLFRAERGQTMVHQSDDFVDHMRQEIEHEYPMVRRAAQEKRVSLVQRLLKTARVYGTIPGLTDEQVSAMIGERWTTGVSVVTQQMLDRVSAHLLGQGERSNRESDRKRITRHHALA